MNILWVSGYTTILSTHYGDNLSPSHEVWNLCFSYPHYLRVSPLQMNIYPQTVSLNLMWVTYPRGFKYLHRLVCVNKTMLYYVVLTAYPLIHSAYYYYNIIFINIFKRILVYRRCG